MGFSRGADERLQAAGGCEDVQLATPKGLALIQAKIAALPTKS